MPAGSETMKRTDGEVRDGKELSARWGNSRCRRGLDMEVEGEDWAAERSR